MKGLLAIPAQKNLETAYGQLQFAAKPLSTKSLIQWSQWTRFDPRLAEVFVSYLLQHWAAHSSVDWNTEIKRQVWPAALGVLLDQTAWVGEREISNWQSDLFKNWSACVMTGVTPAQNELYFIGTRAFAGREARKDALKTLKFYQNWGFLGRDVFKNKFPSTDGAFTDTYNDTLISSHQRAVVLKALINRKTRMSVNDYLFELEGKVSRRQAERDLEKNPHLRAIGRTRGKTYIVKK